MNGIAKTCAGMLARILDFSFAGYGLVCDKAFLKILFHHARYLWLRFRSRWVCQEVGLSFRAGYARAAERFSAYISRTFGDRKEKLEWYFRGR
jgi:hypothetical protein